MVVQKSVIAAYISPSGKHEPQREVECEADEDDSKKVKFVLRTSEVRLAASEVSAEPK